MERKTRQSEEFIEQLIAEERAYRVISERDHMFYNEYLDWLLTMNEIYPDALDRAMLRTVEETPKTVESEASEQIVIANVLRLLPCFGTYDPQFAELRRKRE